MPRICTRTCVIKLRIEARSSSAAEPLNYYYPTNTTVTIVYPTNTTLTILLILL